MGKLSYHELEEMSREMASLVRAGIPLPQGLAELSRAAAKGRMNQAYTQIAAALEQGQPLSEGMTRAAAPYEFVAAVRCAEACGGMEQTLEFAIEHCRRVDAFYSRLANILLYPLMVVACAILILAFLGLVVMPKFVDIYEQLGADLPWPTQALLDMSSVLRETHLTQGLVVLVGVVLIWTCTPLYMRWMPGIMQRLPMFNRLLLLSDVAMVMRFVERMLRFGLPLPAVLQASSLAAWDGRLRSRLQSMAGQAEKGLPVFKLLDGAVPPLPLQMLTVAEERGTLAETCPSVARYCEERFEYASTMQLARLEPLLILLMTLGLGAVVISLYLPLFRIGALIR